jgi:hypothetical protein
MQRAGTLRLLWQILLPGLLRSGAADCRCIAVILSRGLRCRRGLITGKPGAAGDSDGFDQTCPQQYKKFSDGRAKQKS